MTDSLFAVFFDLGLMAARERRLETARHYLTRALMIRRDSVETWNLLGLCCYRLDQLGTAAVCWQNSLDIRPFDNRADIWLRECRQDQVFMDEKLEQIRGLARKRRFRQAITLAEQTRAGRESAAWLLIIGMLKRLSGNLRGAGSAWVQALELDRANQKALSYLIGGQSGRTSPNRAGWLKHTFGLVNKFRTSRPVSSHNERDPDDQLL